MARVGSVLAAVSMVVVVVAVASQRAEALTCGRALGSISTCLGYLRGSGPLLPRCCNGVRALKGAARTTRDRQDACNCLKNAAASMPNLRPALAAGLPRRCGVSIPYPISASTDCSRVR